VFLKFDKSVKSTILQVDFTLLFLTECEKELPFPMNVLRRHFETAPLLFKIDKVPVKPSIILKTLISCKHRDAKLDYKS